MDSTPNPELLRSLGKLARGLSALFWGLPAALLVCAETAEVKVLQPAGLVPSIVANGLILYGLWQMTSFQRQERPWRNALDRAKLLGMINIGLCPFLFFYNRMPELLYYRASLVLLTLSAVLFLFNLNIVIKQLGAMLPDEALRQETRQFTLMNRWLLVLWVGGLGLSALLMEFVDLPAIIGGKNFILAERMGLSVLLFLGLSPVAITMALIWKTKQVILDSVFGAK